MARVTVEDCVEKIPKSPAPRLRLTEIMIKTP